ncbi:UNVERIFIED_CONTAM: hypothetical protein FKN15_025265 [Acipenser sinensis]
MAGSDVYGNMGFHQQTGRIPHVDRRRIRAPAKTAVDDEEEVEYANIEDSIEPEEKTPNSKKPLAEELKPQAATKSNACGAKSIVVLYILLIGSSAVWMALFSRAFAKYSQLSALVTSFGNDMSHLISKVCIKTCPCEWISFNGECYYFSKEQADWHKAKEYCNSKNASLAVISSDQELDSMRLITDVVLPFRFWNSGEPNNAANNEDCGKVTSSKLNDVPCNSEEHWICEMKL